MGAIEKQSYIYIYMFNSGRDPLNPQVRPGKLAPDLPNIVEQLQELVDFQSRGGGPVGHPQGVQGNTLIFNMKHIPKASNVIAWLTTPLCGEVRGNRLKHYGCIRDSSPVPGPNSSPIHEIRVPHQRAVSIPVSSQTIELPSVVPPIVRKQDKLLDTRTSRGCTLDGYKIL